MSASCFDGFKLVVIGNREYFPKETELLSLLPKAAELDASQYGIPLEFRAHRLPLGACLRPAPLEGLPCFGS